MDSAGDRINELVRAVNEMGEGYDNGEMEIDWSVLGLSNENRYRAPEARVTLPDEERYAGLQPIVPTIIRGLTTGGTELPQRVRLPDCECEGEKSDYIFENGAIAELCEDCWVIRYDKGKYT